MSTAHVIQSVITWSNIICYTALVNKYRKIVQNYYRKYMGGYHATYMRELMQVTTLIVAFSYLFMCILVYVEISNMSRSWNSSTLIHCWHFITAWRKRRYSLVIILSIFYLYLVLCDQRGCKCYYFHLQWKENMTLISRVFGWTGWDCRWASNNFKQCCAYC